MIRIFLIHCLNLSIPGTLLVMILIGIEALFGLYILDTKNLRKLSYKREHRIFISHYKIDDYYQIASSIFIIFSYFLIFILGFLALRVSNFGHEVNLKVFLFNIKYLLSSWNIVNITLLVILGLIITCFYIYVFHIINKTFTHTIIRLHLWCYLTPKYLKFWEKPYYENALEKLTIQYHYDKFFKYLRNMLELFGMTRYMQDEEGRWKILALLRTWTDNWICFVHYIILLGLILHDIIFNKFILTHYFYFLPIFMLYALWIRISSFICFHTEYFSLTLAYLANRLEEMHVEQNFGYFRHPDIEWPLCKTEDLPELEMYLNNGLRDVGPMMGEIVTISIYNKLYNPGKLRILLSQTWQKLSSFSIALYIFKNYKWFLSSMHLINTWLFLISAWTTVFLSTIYMVIDPSLALLSIVDSFKNSNYRFPILCLINILLFLYLRYRRELFSTTWNGNTSNRPKNDKQLKSKKHLSFGPEE